MQFSKGLAAAVLLAAVVLTGLAGCGPGSSFDNTPNIPATVEAEVQASLAAATVEAQVQSTLTAIKQEGITNDRDALVAFYNSAGGPRWKSAENWLSSLPLEHWHGVATDDEGRVAELTLILNGLDGTIAPELSNLSNLTHLGLHANDLTGPIPPELSNLSNLTYLGLHANDLTGPIPPELSNLSNLTHLLLGSNDLTGPIPPELVNLPNLKALGIAPGNYGVCVPRSISDWYKGIEFNNGDIYCR